MTVRLETARLVLRAWTAADRAPGVLHDPADDVDHPSLAPADPLRRRVPSRPGTT